MFECIRNGWIEIFKQVTYAYLYDTRGQLSGVLLVAFINFFFYDFIDDVQNRNVDLGVIVC